MQIFAKISQSDAELWSKPIFFNMTPVHCVEFKFLHFSHRVLVTVVPYISKSHMTSHRNMAI